MALITRLQRIFSGWKRSPACPMEVERAEQTFYIHYLKDGMTIFDVGASIGELTLLFSRFVGSGRVHAFEPSSAGYQRLTAVCGAAARPNVILNHLALGDKEEVVRLHVYDHGHLSWSSLADRPLHRYGLDVKPVAVEEVAATTIDAYCERNSIATIDLVKIDVEGAEYQVLLGARRMLKARAIRCIAFEFGQTTFDMGNDPDKISAYLSGLGYKVRNVVQGDPVFPGKASVETARFSMHVAMPC
jgi:FkbM family methyltransferase